MVKITSPSRLLDLFSFTETEIVCALVEASPEDTLSATQSGLLWTAQSRVAVSSTLFEDSGASKDSSVGLTEILAGPRSSSFS